jgi:hypothetical protein
MGYNCHGEIPRAGLAGEIVSDSLSGAHLGIDRPIDLAFGIEPFP